MSFWLLFEVIFAIFNETTAITTAVCKFFASKQGTDLFQGFFGFTQFGPVSSNDHVFERAINDVQWENLKISLRKSRLLFLHLLNLHWQNFKAHCRREYNNSEQILFESRLKGSILRSC